MIVYLDYLSSPFFLIVRAINKKKNLDIKCDVGILKTPHYTKFTFTCCLMPYNDKNTPIPFFIPINHIFTFYKPRSRLLMDTAVLAVYCMNTV